ncbi:porin family protein [Myroides sp. DW712]|uniref:porin family protein n=1 Tax=Myroides sp. DW712 TaxID=3389800 RepID=UPI00397B690A
MSTTLFVLTCVCISLGSINTTHAQKRFKPGLRGGMVVSTLTDLDANYKTDYYVGTQFPIRLTRFYTLQPELSYIRLGAKNTAIWQARAESWGNNTGVFEEADVNMSYLDFIMMNKIHWGKFNVHGGIGVAFLTEGNKYTDYNFDMTCTAGFGYVLMKNIGVEARFRYGVMGLISLKKEDSYELGSNSDIKDLSVQLGLTYSF